MAKNKKVGGVYVTAELESKKFESQAKKFTGNIQKASDNINNKLGKTLKTVGKSIAGVFAVKKIVDFTKHIVKLGSEFEETNSKFKTVFKDVAKESEKTAKILQKNYGQSELSAKKLLSATGDLLTGLGMAGDEALQMSGDVQKLAIDLASFSNLEGGATRASNILTKALLGEREGLKSLGVVISEADLKQKLLEKGMNNLTGETLRQAKAQITLEMAMSQSKNAIGDFQRTQDSFANQTRTLGNNIVNIFSKIGQEITGGIGKDAVGGINSIVESLGGFVTGIITTSMNAKEMSETLKKSSEARGILNLINRYEELTDKQELNKDEQKEILEVQKELLRVQPSLTRAIDDETGAIDTNTKAWKENATQKRSVVLENINNIRESILKQKKFLSIRNEGAKLERFNDLQDEIKTAEKRLNTEEYVKNKLIETQKEIDDFNNKIENSDSKREIRKLKRRRQVLLSERSDMQDALNDKNKLESSRFAADQRYVKNYIKLKDERRKLEIEFTKQEEAREELFNMFLMTQDKMRVEELKLLYGEYYEEFANRSKGIVKTIGSDQEKFIKTTKGNIEKLDLSPFISGLEETLNPLDEIESKIKSLKTELQELIAEGRKEGKVINDKDVKNAEELIKQYKKVLEEQANFEKLKEKSTGIGGKLGEFEGMTSMMDLPGFTELKNSIQGSIDSLNELTVKQYENGEITTQQAYIVKQLTDEQQRQLDSLQAMNVMGMISNILGALQQGLDVLYQNEIENAEKRGEATEGIKKEAEFAKDGLRIAKQSLENFAQGFAKGGPIMGVISMVIGWIMEIIKKSMEFSRTLGKIFSVIGRIFSVVGTVVGIFGELLNSISGFSIIIEAIVAILKIFEPALKITAGLFKIIMWPFQWLIDKISEFADWLSSMIDSAGQALGLIEADEQVEEEEQENIEELLREQNDILKQQLDDLKKLESSMKRLQDIQKELLDLEKQKEVTEFDLDVNKKLFGGLLSSMQQTGAVRSDFDVGLYQSVIRPDGTIDVTLAQKLLKALEVPQLEASKIADPEALSQLKTILGNLAEQQTTIQDIEEKNLDLETEYYSIQKDINEVILTTGYNLEALGEEFNNALNKFRDLSFDDFKNSVINAQKKVVLFQTEIEYAGQRIAGAMVDTSGKIIGIVNNLDEETKKFSVTDLNGKVIDAGNSFDTMKIKADGTIDKLGEFSSTAGNAVNDINQFVDELYQIDWRDIKPEAPSWAGINPTAPSWAGIKPDSPDWSGIRPSLPNWSRTFQPFSEFWQDMKGVITGLQVGGISQISIPEIETIIPTIQQAIETQTAETQQITADIQAEQRKASAMKSFEDDVKSEATFNDFLWGRHRQKASAFATADQNTNWVLDVGLTDKQVDESRWAYINHLKSKYGVAGYYTNTKFSEFKDSLKSGSHDEFKYHTGGLVGLQADEVPAILQKGEVVIQKKSVDSIGQDKLLQMNETGQAGTTINTYIDKIEAKDYIELMNKISDSLEQKGLKIEVKEI